nr:unnamed protein product [Haemonchus contortus]
MGMGGMGVMGGMGGMGGFEGLGGAGGLGGLGMQAPAAAVAGQYAMESAAIAPSPSIGAPPPPVPPPLPPPAPPPSPPLSPPSSALRLPPPPVSRPRPQVIAYPEPAKPSYAGFERPSQSIVGTSGIGKEGYISPQIDMPAIQIPQVAVVPPAPKMSLPIPAQKPVEQHVIEPIEPDPRYLSSHIPPSPMHVINTSPRTSLKPIRITRPRPSPVTITKRPTGFIVAKTTAGSKAIETSVSTRKEGITSRATEPVTTATLAPIRTTTQQSVVETEYLDYEEEAQKPAGGQLVDEVIELQTNVPEATTMALIEEADDYNDYEAIEGHKATKSLSTTTRPRPSLDFNQVTAEAAMAMTQTTGEGSTSVVTLTYEPVTVPTPTENLVTTTFGFTGSTTEVMEVAEVTTTTVEPSTTSTTTQRPDVTIIEVEQVLVDATEEPVETVETVENEQSRTISRGDDYETISEIEPDQSSLQILPVIAESFTMPPTDPPTTTTTTTTSSTTTGRNETILIEQDQAVEAVAPFDYGQDYHDPAVLKPETKIEVVKETTTEASNYMKGLPLSAQEAAIEFINEVQRNYKVL